MSLEMPQAPLGSGQHPVALVVISANNPSASSAFYSGLFGWQLQRMSPELTSALLPAGPMVALRANVPAGFPGVVPYIGVPDVEAMLGCLMGKGGTVERATWSLPMIGKLARFKDPSGTIYGLTDAVSPGGAPRIPAPFGSNPKPPAGALCALEMYSTDGTAARFFGDLFGWGTLATMPQYTAFDAGAGVGGVFQAHTPSLPALAYIYVADVAAKLAEIEAAGGKRLGEPMRMPGYGCFGYFQDPSATSMGLIGP
jgi:predicted enzyme related to lactoylglutathione lyase